LDALTTGLLAVVGILTIAVIVLLVRRSGTGPQTGMLQQQLIELRNRLDALAAAQRDVSQVLAEGRAEQAQTLARQVTELSSLLTRQLESTQATFDHRLADTGKAVADVRERLGVLGEATKRLEALGTSVAEVQELLRVPRLRGTLGEVWLEELLRQIFPSSLYHIQYTFNSGERVDAALELGGRMVCIDSKFPLEACQRMMAAEGDAAERERKAFSRSLRARIDEIADKYIRPEEGTYDFALMYIPAERVYYEAVARNESPEAEDSVIGYALARKVIPVSPNTFYAYLAAILHGLRGLQVERRAREMLDALGGLHQEFDKFQRTHELVGRHLENAVRQHGEAERQVGRIGESLSEITGMDPPPPLPEGGGRREEGGGL
jgi:DNA recombination protein RmuC